MSKSIVTPSDLSAKRRQILDQIEEFGGKYSCYGLRSISSSDPATVGDAIAASKRWEDNTCTGDDMDGTCAISLPYHSDCEEGDVQAAMAVVMPYDGDRIVLLGALRQDYGEDKSEVVMVDAVVLGMWPK